MTVIEGRRLAETWLVAPEVPSWSPPAFSRAGPQSESGG